MSQPPKQDDSKALEEKDELVRARRELGISGLDEGEELIDAETFSTLQDRLIRRGSILDEAPSEPEIAGAAEAGRAEPAPPPADDDELILEEVAAELPADRPRQESLATEFIPASGPIEVARLEAELRRADDRDHVADNTIRLALRHAKASALLVVSRGMIAGLRAGGGGLCERIEGVALSTDVASFLGEPAREGQAYLGPAPREGLDARLLRAMGRSEAVEVLVAPISIGDRVVNLLYADNGTERLPRTSVAALGALTRLVSDAYQGLILARKQARR